MGQAGIRDIQNLESLCNQNEEGYHHVDLDGKYVSPPEETVTMVANVHQAGGSGTFWGKLRGKDESAVVPATCSYFIDQKVI